MDEAERIVVHRADVFPFGCRGEAFDRPLLVLLASIPLQQADAEGCKCVDPAPGHRLPVPLHGLRLVLRDAPAPEVRLGDCGLRRLLAQMAFTRALTWLFRQLSPRLFAKEEDRRRLVDAAQEHLDGLIERENEEEEDEEARA